MICGTGEGVGSLYRNVGTAWTTRARAMRRCTNFHEILAIAMCAVLCGGQGSVEMGLFAKAKEPFLRGFLRLENGVPSHDTFSRLFRSLDPDQFAAAFQRFMAGFSEQSQGVVAIDGKVLRRSFDQWQVAVAHGLHLGVASNALCWRRSPPTRSRTKSAHAHATIPSNAMALSPILVREPENDGLSRNHEDCNVGCIDN